MRNHWIFMNFPWIWGYHGESDFQTNPDHNQTCLAPPDQWWGWTDKSAQGLHCFQWHLECIRLVWKRATHQTNGWNMYIIPDQIWFMREYRVNTVWIRRVPRMAWPNQDWLQTSMMLGFRQLWPESSQPILSAAGMVRLDPIGAIINTVNENDGLMAKMEAPKKIQPPIPWFEEYACSTTSKDGGTRHTIPSSWGSWWFHDGFLSPSILGQNRVADKWLGVGKSWNWPGKKFTLWRFCWSWRE